jgi:hypothetical protein
MRANALWLACVGVSFLVAAPCYAQQSTGSTPPQATAPGSSAPSTSRGPTGSLEKTHDKLRASSLIGANVYNQQGDIVGSIDNLLVGDDGKLADAVISVGGFLGVGAKLVVVPVDHLKIQRSQMSVSIANATAPAGGLGTTPPGTPTSGSDGTTAGGATPPAAKTPDYYSVVLPDATRDTLKQAPEFSY